MRALSMSVVGVIVIGVLLLVGFGAAGAPDEESAEVDALFAAVAHNPAPGAAVMVVTIMGLKELAATRIQ